MLRRVLLPILLACGLLVPAMAGAAKPPAATVGKPEIAWVRVGVVTPEAGQTSPLTGRVIVRVRVTHRGLEDAAVGTQAVGTITVVLSRFEGDRNYSIAGGTASRALPVLLEPLGVIYQVVIAPGQSARVLAAARAGTLRSLVLVDQRVRARGRAPARNGNFLQADASVATLGLPLPVAEPPLMTAGGRRAIIEADATGRGIVRRIDIPLAGGRLLQLSTGGRPANGLVPDDGSPGALGGTITILDGDGTKLAELPAPAGFSLAVSPTGRQRGTLTWPALEVPGIDPIPAGSALLAPPAT